MFQEVARVFETLPDFTLKIIDGISHIVVRKWNCVKSWQVVHHLIVIKVRIMHWTVLYPMTPDQPDPLMHCRGSGLPGQYRPQSSSQKGNGQVGVGYVRKVCLLLEGILVLMCTLCLLMNSKECVLEPSERFRNWNVWLLLPSYQRNLNDCIGIFLDMYDLQFETY